MLFAVLGAVIFGLAQDFWTLALGRALIGVGMASALMGALKALSQLYEQKQFAVVSGVFVALGSVGALAAATPLVRLNELIGWRQVFLWGAVITLISAVAIALVSRDGGVDTSKEEGNVLEVLRDSRIWRIAGLNFALGGSFFAYQSLWLGPYMRDVMQWQPLTIGNALLYLSIGSIAGYFLCGRIANRFGYTETISVASFVVVAIQVLCAFYQPTWSPPLLMLSFSPMGFLNWCGHRLFPTGAWNVP